MVKRPLPAILTARGLTWHLGLHSPRCNNMGLPGAPVQVIFRLVYFQE